MSRVDKYEPIRVIKVRDKKYEIHVDKDGEFRCNVGPTYLKSDRLAELLPRIRREADKQRIEVSLRGMVCGVGRHTGTRWNRKHEPETCHAITVFGVNDEKHTVRYRYDSGGVETERERHGWDSDFMFAKPMTPADVKEWHRLRDARDKARSAFEKFKEKWEWKDVYADVLKAQAEAVDDPKEEPETETDDPR